MNSVILNVNCENKYGKDLESKETHLDPKIDHSIWEKENQTAVT